MSEIRSIIAGATARSLVLVDEICRGTETAKGTCIAGSFVEFLDKVGCLGIVSTHLHGLFSLPLKTKNTVYKAMGTKCVNGQIKPTWKLIDGICRESLAFETAKNEGVPEVIIARAEDLYRSAFPEGCSRELEQVHPTATLHNLTEAEHQFGMSRPEFSSRERKDQMQVLLKEIERAVTVTCQRKLIELYKEKMIPELTEVSCVAVAAREKPPPSTIGASCVYVMIRPDRNLYVGEVLL